MKFFLSTVQPVVTDTSSTNAIAIGQATTDTSNVRHLIPCRIDTDNNAEKLLHIIVPRTTANATDLSLPQSSTTTVEELQHTMQIFI